MTRLASPTTIDEIVHGARMARVRREELAIDAGGVPLVVERTTAPGGPSRRRVLLVHGFAQNRFTWRVSRRSLVAHLAEAGFDVWNVELRGHGRSREAGSPSAREFDEYVTDLAAVIDASSDAPFVVGHSLGGAVGVGAATERPLAGLCTIAGVYTFARANAFLRGVAGLTMALQGPLQALPARVRTREAGRWLGRLHALSDAAGFGLPISGWAPGSMEKDLLAERLERGFDWTSTELWLQLARWARGEPFERSRAFEALELPLLVIAGDLDHLMRPSEARAVVERSRSADVRFEVFEPFEHEVHWGHIDLILGRHAPDHVWPVLTDWLTERA